MTRRVSILLLTGLALSLVPASGCALYSGIKQKIPTMPWSKNEPVVSPIDEEEQRTEGEKMSDFAASAGRSNPNEKKKASSGDTFLFSSKAKEIFNNTER